MRVNTLWKRLKTNLKDPQMRANALALAGGKAIGLALVLTAMGIYVGGGVHAQTPAAPQPTPEINAINTAWTLIAAFLVGLQFPMAKLPMLGAGVLVACIGAGLLFSARAVGRYRLRRRMRDSEA